MFTHGNKCQSLRKKDEEGAVDFKNLNKIFTQALHSELFYVKALSARLRKLTEMTKQLIAIIIVSFIIAKINGK